MRPLPQSQLEQFRREFRALQNPWAWEYYFSDDDDAAESIAVSESTASPDANTRPQNTNDHLQPLE